MREDIVPQGEMRLMRLRRKYEFSARLVRCRDWWRVSRWPVSRWRVGKYRSSRQCAFMFRHAFQPYIDDPPAHKAVLFHDETALIVRDAYPKSKFHYLVIPRLKKITHKHPFDVFKNNPTLYDIIATYVEKAKDMIMEEMQLTQQFASDSPMTNAEYRARFIRAGVHAAPSLANFHIHVISQDFESPCLKHKKHYNSFTTEFFVSYDDLEPFENTSFRDYGYASDSDAGDDSSDASDSEANQPLIRDPHILNNIIRESPLVCTYCGVSFGSGFSRLKLHLALEYAKHFRSCPTDQSRFA